MTAPGYIFASKHSIESSSPVTPPCPYREQNLLRLVQHVANARLNLINGIVKQKPGADVIKTGVLLSLTDHVDVMHMDTTGSTELRESSKERRQEFSQGDDVYKLLPLLTKDQLQKLGMHVLPLRPADDDAHFDITGALIKKDADLRTQVCKSFLYDENQLTLMNQELHDILHRQFDMSAIKPKAHPLYAVYAFQVIHVQLASRILHDRTAIAHGFTALSTLRPRTGSDILMLTDSLHTYSIAFNILGGRPAFETTADPQVLVQILEVIQSSVSSLPFSLQSDVNHALSIIHGLLSAQFPIDANMINNLLLPLYCKASVDESAQSFAAMSLAPTPTRSSPALPVFSETAFYAPPDSRLPQRQYQDNRPRTSDRVVVASQDRRRDQPDHDRRRDTPDHDRRRDPPGHDRPRDSRSAPTSARDRQRLEQDAANIKRAQDDVSKRQAKLAKMRLHHEANLASVQYDDDPDPVQDPDDDDIPTVFAMGASEIRRFQTSSASSHGSSSRHSSSNGQGWRN